MIAVVSHDIWMSDFGQVFHDYNFSLILRTLVEYFLIHELDGDDSILAEMIPLVYGTEHSFSERFRLINVKVITDFLHSFHLALRLFL